MIEHAAASFGEAICDQAVIVSPLLNLAPARPAGAKLVQHRPLLPSLGSSLSGTAMLSLSADRRTLQVSVEEEHGFPVRLRLRGLPAEPAGRGSGMGARLLLIEVTRTSGAAGKPSKTISFDLGRRSDYQLLPRSSRLRPLPDVLLACSAAAIDGITVDPTPDVLLNDGRQAFPNPDGAYFRNRMLIEIGAALQSKSAVATSRHVQLATLYARQL